MRNLLAFMMALLLTLGGLGYYLDWFRIRSAPGTDGHTTLNIDLNTVKAYQDVSKAATKGAQLLDKKAKEEADKAEAEKKAKGAVEAGKTAVQTAQPKSWIN